MARGIRNETLERVLAARLKQPLAIGPLLGEYTLHLNMPLSLLAELTGTHEQTVARWVFGQSTVQAYWLPVVMKVLGMLVWLHYTGAAPLQGTHATKHQQLQEYMKAYRAAATSTSRVLKPAA